MYVHTGLITNNTSSQWNTILLFSSTRKIFMDYSGITPKIICTLKKPKMWDDVYGVLSFVNGGNVSTMYVYNISTHKNDTSSCFWEGKWGLKVKGENAPTYNVQAFTMPLPLINKRAKTKTKIAKLYLITPLSPS